MLFFRKGGTGSIHFLKQGIPIVLNILFIKLNKNKSRHNFINNLSAATYFSFVSHLQREYTIVV